MKIDISNAPTRTQALESITSRWPACSEIEYVPLQQSIGRVVAKELYSFNTLPVCRVSSFDGFAVRSQDFENGLPDTSAWQQGIEYVPADTGDDFPDGYDTIIPVEDISFDEKGVMHFANDFKFVKGSAVKPAGTTVRQGELIVNAHSRVTAELAGAMAIGGIRFVPVFKKLKVVFIPTGSELVSTGTTPRRGENVDSNSLMISVLLEQWGAEVISLPIISDDIALLDRAVTEALDVADMVVINGGSSKGGEDFNYKILEKRASFFSHGVRAVPGRPVGLAIISGKPVINLPGPALAAWVASDWLLKGLVFHYYSMPVPVRQRVNAVLTTDIKKASAFDMITRVELKRTGEGFTATPLSRSSSMPEILRQGKGLLTVPIECNGYSNGDIVQVELLTGIEQI
jgi:molybdopterin molybdotransferase/putative molybdopterin biosynthesis protein